MNAASLDQLRDIHLPPAPALPALLPEAWAMWAAVAAALTILAAALWGLRRFVRRRHQRCALRELSSLRAQHAHDGDTTQLARGLSQLVRRHAMRRFPAADVAGLTDVGWLHFLDAHGGDGAFVSGAGAALAWRPYRCDGAVDEAALIDLVRHWLRANPI